MQKQLVTYMSLKDWGLLLFLGLIWGSSFLFAHIAVVEIPPLTLVFLRITIAFIALALVMASQGYSFKPMFTHFFPLSLLGLLNCTLPWFLIFESQKNIGPGMGGILNATVPIFIVIMAHYMTRDEKMSGHKIAGVLAGFCGVVLLMGPSALKGFGADALAELEGLVASVVYALGGIYARKFKDIPPIAVSAGSLMAAPFYMLPLSLLIDHSYALPVPSIQSMGAVVSIALLSTAFAFVLFYKLLARVGATDASLVAFLIPISAIGLGILFKGEQFSLIKIAGMAVIGLSIVIIDGRVWKKLRPEPETEPLVCPK